MIIYPDDKDTWYDICKVSDRIFIGNAEDAQDKSQIDKHGITAIINVSRDLRNGISNWRELPGIDYTHVPLFDGPGNTKETFACAVFTLRDLLFKGHNVLVHCRAGISRSAAVITCYLWATGLYSLEAAERQVRNARPIIQINPALEKLILELKGH